jgi:hypothetical protein
VLGFNRLDDEADLEQTHVVRQDHSPRDLFIGCPAIRFLMKPRIQEGIHEYVALDERSTVFGGSIP